MRQLLHFLEDVAVSQAATKVASDDKGGGSSEERGAVERGGHDRLFLLVVKIGEKGDEGEYRNRDTGPQVPVQGFIVVAARKRKKIARKDRLHRAEKSQPQ